MVGKVSRHFVVGTRQYFKVLGEWCGLALPTLDQSRYPPAGPAAPGRRNGSCLTSGAGIRTRSSVHVGSDDPRLHPPGLLCTTHVTRPNTQSPVNNSPCLRYTTFEPHRKRTRTNTRASNRRASSERVGHTHSAPQPRRRTCSIRSWQGGSCHARGTLRRDRPHIVRPEPWTLRPS